MTRSCYIAGPLFSEQDRQTLELLARQLEGRGVSVYLPHRDAGDLGIVSLEDDNHSRRLVFQKDVDAVRRVDFVVCLLDGQDCDSGTCVEVGMAYEAGKPIFGLKTDLDRRGRVVNNMVWGICDAGHALFTDLNELWGAVDRYLKGGTR
jgi:nucleoside 2-deoxyribosyltransferase